MTGMLISDRENPLLPIQSASPRALNCFDQVDVGI